MARPLKRNVLGRIVCWVLVADATIGVNLGAPLFPNQEFATGGHPTSSAVGDFNGDGRQDLAVANSLSNSVSVLLGQGDGTFGPATDFAAGVSPWALTIGDFNGDGRQDLAVANLGSPPYDLGDVSILLGRGDGAFSPQTRVAVGTFPASIAVGDFNADGRQDLVVALVSNHVSVVMGRGDGSFGSHTEFVADARPTCVAVADFNGDGRRDLAVANENSNDVSILLADGGGLFGPRVNIALGSSPNFVISGDFNEDALPDLAVLSGGKVSILLGRGDGTFGPQTLFGVGGIPQSIAVGEFNGDGHPDLAVANSYTNDVSILLGQGDGTFGHETRFWAGASPDAIAEGDFDADGHQDLIVTNGDSSSVSILLGQGNGAFGRQITLMGIYLGFIVSADFNGDGIQDLAQASGWIGILLGRGDGTFNSPIYYPAGDSPVSIAVGDFDGDGHPDLAAANSDSNDISILLNAGDGTFGTETRFAAGSDPTSITVGDFNADGRQDVAVSNRYNYNSDAGVSVLLGRGDGTFDPQAVFAAGGNPNAIVAGDLNADGRQDLAVANNSGNVSVLLGRGDGTFDRESRFEVGVTPLSILMADFNGDGRQDLAAVNDGTSDVSYLIGDGHGNFSPQTRVRVGGYPRSAVVGDFNADGRPDLAVTNSYTDDISVLLAGDDGTFGHELRFAAGDFASPIAAGDFNGDGREDIAVVNAAPSLIILLNQGPYPPHPHAAITAPTVVECDQVGGADVSLDGSTSQDSAGGSKLITYEWLRDPGLATERVIGTGVNLRIFLELGTTPIGLRVQDAAGLKDVATMTVKVEDTMRPALVCPTIGAVECSAPGGSAVSVTSTATDLCSPTISITNTRTGGGGEASGFYPLGTTRVAFTATDASGNTARCASSVEVHDTVPPALTLTPAPATVWPPNHRMVLVQSAWQVSDVCDPASSVTLAGVTSSEADDAPGNSDGDTTGDIQDASVGTADSTILLRAERSGDGGGRIYTLTYAARDASGNTSSALGIVSVPHDLGTGPEPLILSLERASAAGMAHVFWKDQLHGELRRRDPGDWQGVLLPRPVSRDGSREWLGDGVESLACRDNF